MKITLSENLIALRKAAGLTQEQLASKLYVTRQAVSKWERAESAPDLETLAALGELYSVTLDELICGKMNSPIEIKVTEIPENAELKKAQRRKLAREMVFFALFVCGTLSLLTGIIFTSLIDSVEHIWLIWLALPVLAPLAFGIRFYGVFGKTFIMYFLNVPIICMLVFEICVLTSANNYGAWLVFLFIPLYYALAAAVTVTAIKKNRPQNGRSPKGN